MWGLVYSKLLLYKYDLTDICGRVCVCVCVGGGVHIPSCYCMNMTLQKYVVGRVFVCGGGGNTRGLIQFLANVYNPFVT